MTQQEAKVQMASALRNAVGTTLDDMEPLDKLEAGLTNGFEYRFCRDTVAMTEVSVRLMTNFKWSYAWTVSLHFHFWAFPSDNGPKTFQCVPEALAFADAAITAAKAMPCIKADAE